VSVLDAIGVPAGRPGVVGPVLVRVADVGRRGKLELQFARAKSSQVVRLVVLRGLAVEDVVLGGRVLDAKVVVVARFHAFQFDLYSAGVDDELIILIDGVCVRLAGAPGIQREDENDEAAAEQRNPLPRGETESSSLWLHHTPAPWGARLPKNVNK
jgi:hypothetical protein